MDILQETPDRPPHDEIEEAFCKLIASADDWTYMGVATRIVQRYPALAAKTIAWAMKHAMPAFDLTMANLITEVWLKDEDGVVLLDAVLVGGEVIELYDFLRSNAPTEDEVQRLIGMKAIDAEAVLNRRYKGKAS